MVITRSQSSKKSITPIQHGWALGRLSDQTYVRIVGWSYGDVIASCPFRGGGMLYTTNEFTVDQIDPSVPALKRAKFSEAHLISGEYITYGSNTFSNPIAFFS